MNNDTIERTIPIQYACIKCGKHETHLMVSKKDILLYKRGCLAQNAFRYLDEDAQYMLDYKVCKECFDKN